MVDILDQIHMYLKVAELESECIDYDREQEDDECDFHAGQSLCYHLLTPR